MGRRNAGVAKTCWLQTEEGLVIGVVSRDRIDEVDFVGVSSAVELILAPNT